MLALARYGRSLSPKSQRDRNRRKGKIAHSNCAGLVGVARGVSAPARWVGSKEGVRESFLPRLHEVVWMKSSPRIGHGGIGGSWNAPLIGGQSSGDCAWFGVGGEAYLQALRVGFRGRDSP